MIPGIILVLGCVELLGFLFEMAKLLKHELKIGLEALVESLISFLLVLLDSFSLLDAA